MRRKLRDTQRLKLYRAEAFAFEKWEARKRLMTLPEVEAYLRRVFASKRFQKRWPKAKCFLVADGRARRRAAGRGESYAKRCWMTLPKWARTDWIVLHELAHGLTALHTLGPHAGHGWEFCANYLELVRLFIGKDEAKRLRAEYRKCHVRCTPKRARKPLTDEQRAALVARLAKVREAAAARPPHAAYIVKLSQSIIKALNIPKIGANRREAAAAAKTPIILPTPEPPNGQA